MAEYKAAVKNIWVQKMNMPQAFFLCVKNIFSGYMIRYEEHGISRIAAKFLFLAKKTGLCKNFLPAGLLMAEREGDGFALLQNMFKGLDGSINSFLEEYLAAEPHSIKMALRSYISEPLRDTLAFITMANKKAGEAGRAHEDLFYIRRHPLNHIFIDNFRKDGIKIAESGLWEMLRFHLMPYLKVAASILFRFLPQRDVNNINSVKPSIWIEYAPLDIMDFAFWSPYVEKDKFDIVAYFDRPVFCDMDKVKAKVTLRGFKWARLSLPILSRLGKIDLRRLFGELPCSGYHNLPSWVNAFRVEYRFSSLLYEAVFKRFKVKVLIQHQEASWVQSAQAAAVKSAGGIMIGYNWSNYYFRYLPTHIFPQHVYFVWADEVKRHIENIDKPHYLLPSGSWALPHNDTPSELNGLDTGIKFKIAIFDNSTGYAMQYSPEMLSSFYLELLKLLEENTEWGGIVKGKSYELAALKFLPRGEEIVAKMNMLIEAKRLVVLDRNYSPLAASAHADLSVCFGLNTAGIIAGINGFRAIHWDCGGILRSIENTEYYKDVVYGSLKDLAAAILKAASGDMAVGDFSNHRKQFNYFDDSSAPRRVGDFIQTFMGQILKTGEPDQALNFSVKDYIVKNRIEQNIPEVSFEKTYA